MRLAPALLLLALCAPALAAPPRPLYYERVIAAADLDGRTLRELTLLRNTIFARAGQPFRKQWLRDYFTKQSWYRPAPSPKAVGSVTPLDRANAAAIARHEGALPKAELKKRLARLDGGDLGGLAPDEAAIERALLARALGLRPKEPSPAAIPGNPLDDPQALDRLLTLAQLGDLSRRDLRLLRNTVYARKGRRFKSDLLQQYFDLKDWYRIDDRYSDRRLSKTDQRNIALIRSLEASLGGPLTDDEHKAEDGWMLAA